MRYTLSDSFIARQGAITRWKCFFVGVAALVVAVVAQQQSLPYASAVGVAAMVAAAGVSVRLWILQCRIAKRARNVWLELTETTLVYGYETGETQIYLDSIKSTDLAAQAWPVLTLTLKDGSYIALQGFGSIEEIAASIKQFVPPNMSLQRTAFGGR
ncbi:MAG TPA: hypothetical protein VGK09_14550 [Rhodocyclaceae bacterium]|jgi:hypothetical protein